MPETRSWELTIFSKQINSNVAVWNNENENSIEEEHNPSKNISLIIDPKILIKENRYNNLNELLNGILLTGPEAVSS